MGRLLPSQQITHSLPPPRPHEQPHPVEPTGSSRYRSSQKESVDFSVCVFAGLMWPIQFFSFPAQSFELEQTAIGGGTSRQETILLARPRRCDPPLCVLPRQHYWASIVTSCRRAKRAVNDDAHQASSKTAGRGRPAAAAVPPAASTTPCATHSGL